MKRSAMISVVAIALLMSAPVAGAQSDEPGYSGPATIVDVGTRQPITEGDVTVEFTLDLPDAASCPGDSRNDGYRYQSFLLPPGTDVGELAYDGFAPLGGENYYPLRGASLSLFVHELLAPNGRPGLPGLIPIDFRLTFDGWPEPGLPEGRYIFGIACTDPDWQVVQYWVGENEIELEKDPTRENGEVTWRLVDADSATLVVASDADGEGGVPWVPLLLLAAAALGVALVFGRRRTSTSTSNQERQLT